MEKRGQVTTFMIVGLIIFFIVAGVYLVNQYLLKSALEREAERVSQVPQQIQPIKDHLDSCLKFLSVEAIRLSGSQGGYIDMPRDNLPTNSRVPFSSTLEVSPGIQVPYWFYETSNGIQKHQVPAMDEIQKQISDYLVVNAISCISGLNDFATQGFSFDVNFNISSDVEIQDDKVITRMTIPIAAKIKDVTFNFKNTPIVASIDVPYGKMYKVAEGIQKQDDEGFFEEKTFDAMVAFSEIPVSGTEFSCIKKIWNKQQVVQSMKQVISTNMNAIRLTGNYQEKNDLYKYFDLDPGVDSSNLDTLFLYSNRWPMTVDVIPSDGDLMTSDQLSQKFSDQVSGIISSILCINNWNFVYTAKYPLLISLIDPIAIEGQGFTFQFADLVILDHNQPKKNVLGTYDQPEFKLPICQYPTTNVTVYTFTADLSGTLVPLDNVDIKYKCFTSNCEIGATSTDASGQSFTTSLFPACINGLLTGEKEGYYKAQQFISTNEPQIASLILERIKTLNLNVKLIEKDTGAIRDPYESESVVFTLDNLDNDFSTSFVYPGTATVDLIPGTYDVKSYIIGNSTWPITIKGGTIHKCVETPQNTIWGIIFNDRKCTDIKIDDMVVNEVMKGGAEFNWTVPQDIYSKDGITFYTMADHLPGDYQSLNLLYSSISRNAEGKYFREPE